tara:strand:+ start:668 stop:1132 length:465 start_codon:yes stop_codon:yes gene_type:complete
VTSTRHFRDAENVALYVAFDGEIDCHRILGEALSAGKACFLPALAGPSLEFREASANSIVNRFGIQEPRHDATRIPISRLDLILVPLVGFDHRGNRIGMGKGFYDRALASVRTAPQPVRVGVAWACQEVPGIVPGEHDVPLHAIVTEDGWRVGP